MKNKAQTATEYLIILAVVIVIALIVVGVLGGIPSIGGGVSKSAKLAQLSSKPVGVTNYAFLDSGSKLRIKNNQPNTISVNSIWVDQVPCSSIDPQFPFQLKVGETKLIDCLNFDSTQDLFNDLVIEYTDLNSNTEYSTENGLSKEEFKGTSSTDCWPGAYSDPQDICTCDDLNKTRTVLDGNYSLKNNIDFSDCDSSYTTGEGWEPIGNFEGSIDGGDHIIHNLYINRGNDDRVGLIGNHVLPAPPPYGSGLNIDNLYIISAKITGNDYVGAFLGDFGLHLVNSDFENLRLLSSQINGNSYVGGLIGGTSTYTYNTVIDNSYVKGSIITATGDNVGGLVGKSQIASRNLIITDSYFSGTLSGNNYVGGLVGNSLVANSGDSILDSFSEGEISGNDLVGGLVGGFGYSGIINRSYSSADIVSTGTYVGGLVGQLTNGATLDLSYFSGSIIGGIYVGGLLGQLNSGGLIKNSFSMSSAVSGSSSGGLVGYKKYSEVTNSYWINSTGNPSVCIYDDQGSTTSCNLCTSLADCKEKTGIN